MSCANNVPHPPIFPYYLEGQYWEQRVMQRKCLGTFSYLYVVTAAFSKSHLNLAYMRFLEYFKTPQAYAPKSHLNRGILEALGKHQWCY